MRRRKAFGSPFVGENLAVGNANPGFMGPELIRLQKLHWMGGHDRQTDPAGQRRGGPHMIFIFGMIGALQLQVISPRKTSLPLQGQLLGMTIPAGEQSLSDVTGGSARQNDQAAVVGTVLIKPGRINFGTAPPFVIQPGLREQLTNA